MRVSYSFINLIGDIGGVQETMVGFFGIVLFTISKFSFTLALIKKYFLIETKEKELFKTKERKPNKKLEGVEKYISPEITKKIGNGDPNNLINVSNRYNLTNHHKMSLSTYQIIKLYLFQPLKMFKNFDSKY